MPEYSLDFSSNLIEAASMLTSAGIDEIDEQRTVLYLSLLSSEITLKAILEKSGFGIRDLKRIGHNITELLACLSECKYETEEYGTKHCTEVRAITIKTGAGEATIGKLLSAEKQDITSKYPNEIRYGGKIIHYPASAMLKAAKRLHEWAEVTIKNDSLSREATTE